MVGPSASGSLKGTPSSITSAPASASASSTSSPSAGDGKPAVVYRTSAALPSVRHRWKVPRSLLTRSVDILLDIDAVSVRIGCFDDGPERIAGLWIALAQIDGCLLYTSPSPRDGLLSRMPSS